jgi:hypothetical protein
LLNSEENVLFLKLQRLRPRHARSGAMHTALDAFGHGTLESGRPSSYTSSGITTNQKVAGLSMRDAAAMSGVT